MPNVVFKDESLEKEFNQKGYVKLPFLNPSEVDHLKKMFFETIAQSGGPKTSGDVDFDSKSIITYDFTFIDKNTDYKRKVYDIITTAFQEKTNQILNNYRPIIANYIRKQKDGGEVPMHQNWAFVDEVKYTSVSVWVPLVDSNERNGTLQMVDGSHKRFGQFRGPMVPWELRHLKEDIISKHLTPMNVKAGECVILDDSIIHYSNINTTSGLRLAIQLILVPEEATTLHYHLDRETDTSNIQVLETDLNFYMNFHPWLKPIGKKQLGAVPFKEQNFSYQDFLNGLKSPRFDEVKIKKVSPLFKDESLQQQFEKDGFVKINLLDNKEVSDLLSYYHSLNHDHIGEYGFHVSLDNDNEDYIKDVFKKLFGVLVPKLNPILNEYKPFTASYVIKEAGLQNIVPPHQDWTFVDETKFCSATVWIPLIDVNKNNGALSVIRGSHKVFNEPRMSPSPQSKSVFSAHLFDIFPYVEVIDMKAGEALIFNNRTVHASPPNISGSTRIGVGIGITQKDAQLVHHFELPSSNGKVNVYKVDETFFVKVNNKKLSHLYTNNQEPKGLEVFATYKKNNPNYTKEEITSLIATKTPAKFNEALMKELAKLYNYNINGTPKKTNYESNNSLGVEEKKQIEAITPVEQKEWVDTRRFFEKYSFPNIVKEIKHRFTQKKL